MIRIWYIYLPAKKTLSCCLVSCSQTHVHIFLFVILKFLAKTNCQECDALEYVLENIQDELKDVIGGIVVKAQNSHMVNLYNPSKEPALIYFRRGMPLLYYGSTNAEEIVQVFSENREPIVKELADVNFEHLTQAASGATTGDWFLFL